MPCNVPGTGDTMTRKAWANISILFIIHREADNICAFTGKFQAVIEIQGTNAQDQSGDYRMFP